jgi:hypothetical protein
MLIKIIISHPTWAQNTLSATGTVHVSQGQQFASRAYCGVMGPVSNMALQQVNAFSVLRFVSRSVVIVQHEFHAWFKKDAPHKNNVTGWYREFFETGYLCKDRSLG